MQRSGGNAKLVEYLSSRGIEKNMKITTKYNTKQAAYYRDRLSRWLDGKTEPPPDPGRYDPVTGVSEAQGAEPLPGETTDQYNARQAKLRDDARERLRAKFGGSGGGGFGSGSMQGMGSPEPANEGGLGIGGVLGGVGSFFKNNVIDNETVRGVAGGAIGFAGNAINSAKQAVADGEVIESIKMNARGEDGTLFRKSLGAIGNVVGAVRGNSGDDPSRSGSFGGSGGTTEDDEAFFASIGKKSGYDSSAPPVASGNGNSNGTAKNNFFNDDNWGGTGASVPTPKEDPKQEMDRLRKEMGMNLAEPVKAPVVAAAPAMPPQKPPTLSNLFEPSPVKKAPAKLTESDDFFAEFGV
jgi:hypothetical protein